MSRNLLTHVPKHKCIIHYVCKIHRINRRQMCGSVVSFLWCDGSSKKKCWTKRLWQRTLLWNEMILWHEKLQQRMIHRQPTKPNFEDRCRTCTHVNRLPFHLLANIKLKWQRNAHIKIWIRFNKIINDDGRMLCVHSIFILFPNSNEYFMFSFCENGLR